MGLRSHNTTAWFWSRVRLSHLEPAGNGLAAFGKLPLAVAAAALAASRPAARLAARLSSRLGFLGLASPLASAFDLSAFHKSGLSVGLQNVSSSILGGVHSRAATPRGRSRTRARARARTRARTGAPAPARTRPSPRSSACHCFCLAVVVVKNLISCFFFHRPRFFFLAKWSVVLDTCTAGTSVFF